MDEVDEFDMNPPHGSNTAEEMDWIVPGPADG